MKKFTPKSKGIILLLILLAAGWIVYKSQSKHKKLLEEKSFGQPFSQDKLLNIKGSILKFGSNHEGDIDKILLSTDKRKIWLHFPPHTARQVTSVAKINSAVDAVISQKTPDGPDKNVGYELKYLRGKNSRVSVDLAQIPAPFPRKGFEVEITGIPSEDIENKYRPNTSFILSGKLISIPPHMARDLLPLINQAKKVKVKGQMRDTTEGFLSISGMKVVKPNFIQIDSITYKIR